MDLLDFPPEIFKHVIHCLVSDFVVYDSWPLRSVCRTFDQEISENILAIQPREAFVSKSSRHILSKKENLKYYLAYHVKTPRDVLPELPAKIQKMVKYVTKELEATNGLNDRNLLLEVCAGVARTSRHPYAFLWRYEPTLLLLEPYPDYELEWYQRRRQGLSPDITFHDQLIAAISVGAQDAVAQLLLQAPTRLPEGAFEDPMVACVRQDDQEMINFMMKALDRHRFKRFKKEQVISDGSPYSIGNAMDTAITSGRVDMVKLLLGYFCRHLKIPNKTHYRRWIDYAIHSQRIEVLKALLQVAPDAKPYHINSAIFEKGLRTGNPAIVSTLIEYGSIELDSNRAQLSALAASIRQGGGAVIRAVVEAGADIDLVLDRHRLKHVGAVTPLEYAIYLNNFEAVCYLIRCGASVPATCTLRISKRMQAAIKLAPGSQKKMTKQKI